MTIGRIRLILTNIPQRMRQSCHKQEQDVNKRNGFQKYKMKLKTKNIIKNMEENNLKIKRRKHNTKREKVNYLII